MIRSRTAVLLFILTFLWTSSGAQSHLASLEYDDVGVSNETLKARRLALMEKAGDKAVIMLYAAPMRTRNNDVEYEYRQDDDLFYLTGFKEQNAVLVLIPKGTSVPDPSTEGKTLTVHEVLFVQDRDPATERWNGRRYGPEGAMKVRGIEYATTIDKLSSMVPRMMFGGVDYLYIPPFKEDFTGDIAESMATFRSMLDRYGSRIERRDPTPMIHSMRAIKDKEEIALLREASRISALAHNAAMRTVKPGMYEYELEAVYDYTFGTMGAEAPGYPSIVGSGENTCILHYNTNRKKIADGDLVLTDCAAEYRGYSSDVTRTFPANGTFSKEQREIYVIVLAAQKAAFEAIKPGVSWSDVSEAARSVIAKGLSDLGLISSKDGREVGKFYWHGLGHAVGLNVHDVSSATMEPGVLYTVEPGIYIPAGTEGVPEKYFNIGVRIEDVVLVTEDGHEVLSSVSPTDPDEIEKIMKEEGMVMRPGN